jgi:hypothetical protein
LSRPVASIASRAAATASASLSIPVTDPDGPTRSAITVPRRAPQPRSATRARSTIPAILHRSVSSVRPRSAIARSRASSTSLSRSAHRELDEAGVGVEWSCAQRSRGQAIHVGDVDAIRRPTTSMDVQAVG